MGVTAILLPHLRGWSLFMLLILRPEVPRGRLARSIAPQLHGERFQCRPASARPLESRSRGPSVPKLRNIATIGLRPPSGYYLSGNEPAREMLAHPLGEMPPAAEPECC